MSDIWHARMRGGGAAHVGAPGDREHVGRQAEKQWRTHVSRRVQLWLAPREPPSHALLTASMLSPFVAPPGAGLVGEVKGLIRRHARGHRLLGLSIASVLLG